MESIKPSNNKEQHQETDKDQGLSEQNEKVKSEYFSDKKFSDFELSPSILETLNDLGYETATEIQAKTLPISLNGEDIIGSAKTGSGKSLAFLIPSAEIILKNKIYFLHKKQK